MSEATNGLWQGSTVGRTRWERLVDDVGDLVWIYAKEQAGADPEDPLAGRGPDGTKDVEVLREIYLAQVVALRALREAHDRGDRSSGTWAHHYGASYERLAEVTDMSRQGAWQRYRPPESWRGDPLLPQPDDPDVATEQDIC